MEKVLITGGSGLIGGKLSALLTRSGYEVIHLSRRVTGKEKFKTFSWNIEEGQIDLDSFKGISHIIHLAGAGIADKPWSKKRKLEILNSRTQSVDLLFKAYQEIKPEQLKTFITASGIGWYGMGTDDTIYSEESGAAPDFVAQVCLSWEKAASAFEPFARVAALRTGIVLSTDGGALPKIDAPIKLWSGAPLGSGKQWIPWIHINDLCEMYQFALKNPSFTGAYNAVVPANAQVTNESLTVAIAHKLNKPLFLPNIPEFVLKLMLGEMAQLVLRGSRVSAEKISKEGFTFEFETLTKALDNLYPKKSS
ncbi:MAG: TIGR01777 family oxidoreductase [Luteibaculaceae bacterium]